MPRGKRISYSREEDEWLEANRLLPISEYHAAFVETFVRPDVMPKHLHSLRKRRGWRTGRTGYFAKGQEPINKGVKCAPGTGGRHPNARRTQFKGGVRQGIAVKLYKPIGTERLSKEGYLERKIHDGLPLQSRWRAVHLLNWEAANGPIPKGHCLKCLGDRGNVDPSNWQLIPRALLPRLNGGKTKKHVAYDGAADELKPTILAIAQVEHAARQIRKGGES